MPIPPDRQAAVAEQPVVSDLTFSLWRVVVRLADADAAAEDAAVALEHVVGDLEVPRVRLQLDAADALAVTGREPDAVDARGVKLRVAAAVRTRVVRLRDDGDLGALKHRVRRVDAGERAAGGRRASPGAWFRWKKRPSMTEPWTLKRGSSGWARSSSRRRRCRRGRGPGA